MSFLTYLASNAPFDEVSNPHYQQLSVNEALAKGMEDIPEFMLMPGFDRDMPGMILWSDVEIVIDTDTGAMTDGDYDDDFAIWEIDRSMESVHTEKKYCASIEWGRCTAGRAARVIEYIRAQLKKSEEIELWHIWMNDGYLARRESKTIPIDALRSEDIVTLVESDVNKGEEFGMLTQYRLVITK